MSLNKALMPLTDYDNTVNAIKAKLYEQGQTYLSSELASKIASIDTGKMEIDYDFTLDHYTYDIQAWPEECDTAWTRPATWPNLDALTLNSNEIYLTYNNASTSDFASFVVYCTSSYYVEIGNVVDGSWTVLEASTTLASAANYTNDYDSTLPAKIVYHITVPAGESITDFKFLRRLGMDSSNYYPYYLNGCVEAYYNLPSITSFNTISNGGFGCYNIEHSYVKGVTTACTSCARMFCYGINERKVEFVSCNFGAVTDMSNMFAYCRMLKSVDLRNCGLTSGRDVRTNLQYMFQYCVALREVITDSNVKIYASNAAQVFQGCWSLKEIDVSWIDLTNSTTMASMFDGCQNLRTITFGTEPWTICTNVSSMFANCIALTTVDLSHITGGEQIVNYSSMFSGCYQLSGTLDMSGLETYHCTTFASMFSNCYRLTTIKLTKFQPAAATSMTSMFNSCYNVTTIDLGSDASKHSAPACTRIDSMFNHCRSLKSLTLDGLNLVSVSNMYGVCSNCWSLEYLSMNGLHLTACKSCTRNDTPTATGSSYTPWFYCCYSLREVHLDELNPGVESCLYYRTSSSATNYSNIFIDAKFLNKIYCNNLTSTTLTSLAWLGAGMSGSLYNNYQLEYVELKNIACTNASFSFANTFSNARKLKKVDFGTPSGTKPTSIAYMFSNCYTLEEVVGFYGFDFTACTSAIQTFYCCYSLKELDIRAGVFTVCTRFDNFCANCYALEDVDLTYFTIGSACTQMNSMFAECWQLREIDMQSFAGGSGLTNVSSMFSGCRNLASITWPNITTTYVQNFASMFSNCWNLEEIDLSNFTTTRATSFSSMFSYCYSLEELDCSTFTTPSSLTTVTYMFYQCRNLKTVDCSNMTSGGITAADYMFSGCYSLRDIDVSNLALQSVKTINGMFGDCKTLTELDLTSFNLSAVTGFGSLFSGCENIQSIDMRNATWTAVATNNVSFLPGTSRLRYLRIGTPGTGYNWTIAAAENLTRECLLEILDDLPTLTTAKTLKISAANMAKLTAAERTAISTNKKWTISA